MSWNSNLSISFELNSDSALRQAAFCAVTEYEEFNWFLSEIGEYKSAGTRMMFCWAKQFNHLNLGLFLSEFQKLAIVLYKLNAIPDYCNILIMHEVEQAEKVTIYQINNGVMKSTGDIPVSWGVW